MNFLARLKKNIYTNITITTTKRTPSHYRRWGTKKKVTKIFGPPYTHTHTDTLSSNFIPLRWLWFSKNELSKYQIYMKREWKKNHKMKIKRWWARSKKKRKKNFKLKTMNTQFFYFQNFGFTLLLLLLSMLMFRWSQTVIFFWNYGISTIYESRRYEKYWWLSINERRKDQMVNNGDWFEDNRNTIMWKQNKTKKQNVGKRKSCPNFSLDWLMDHHLMWLYSSDWCDIFIRIDEKECVCC